MSNLIEFYKRAVENVGLHVPENNYIYSNAGDNKVIVTCDGLPMVLPTQEHINSAFEKDPDSASGFRLTKVIYNPLNEDVIKGDTASLKKTKVFVERRLGHIVASLGEMLLLLANNEQLQRKTNTEVNKFLGSIIMAQNQGIKQIVDDKTIEKWAAIYKATLNSPNGMFTIFLKKSGVDKGVKYNRLCTLRSDVYTALIKAKKDEAVYGVKLRNKDLVVFRLLFEYIVEGLSSEEAEGDKVPTISIGCNDTTSPAFVGLYTLYTTIVSKTNRILNNIKHVSNETYDSAYVKDLITLEELHNLSIYHQELANIPNEHDISRQAHIQSKIGAMTLPEDVPSSVNTNGPYPTAPVNLKDVNQPEPTDDPVLKALYGGNRPPAVAVPLMANTPVMAPMQQVATVQPIMSQYAQVQQPMVQQPMQMMQPRPMGINQVGMQQPMQPMYQQPMIQQPMGQITIPNIANPNSYYR